MKYGDMSTRKLFRKLRAATKDLHFFGRRKHSAYVLQQMGIAREGLRLVREELNRRGWGV